jgi:hypothetical protein
MKKIIAVAIDRYVEAFSKLDDPIFQQLNNFCAELTQFIQQIIGGGYIQPKGIEGEMQTKS